MEPFTKTLEAITGVMRAGAVSHPDNDGIRRTPEYHIGRTEEHLRLLHEGDQRQGLLALHYLNGVRQPNLDDSFGSRTDSLGFAGTALRVRCPNDTRVINPLSKAVAPLAREEAF